MPLDTGIAQRLRAQIAAEVLDLLPSDLLLDVRLMPTNRDAWDLALSKGLSSGERAAVDWLAGRVWDDHQPTTTYEDLIAKCDRDLVQALSEAGAQLTELDEEVAA